jgi:uncharacterized YigZ family protein
MPKITKSHMLEEKIKKLKNTAEIEFIEKKSLFIGFSTSVKNEDEALEIIKQKKKQFSDATHNVYAYILGDGTVARYSDDGEPQGTAGMPVLNAIRMSGITDVCVVVTRYFGGILLGAGGLVRAYSTAASMALDAGGIALFEEFAELQCRCTYSEYQKLQNMLELFEAKIDSTEFLAEVSVKFAIPKDKTDSFNEKLNETFSARFRAELLGTRFDTK